MKDSHIYDAIQISHEEMSRTPLLNDGFFIAVRARPGGEAAVVGKLTTLRKAVVQADTKVREDRYRIETMPSWAGMSDPVYEAWALVRVPKMYLPVFSEEDLLAYRQSGSLKHPYITGGSTLKG